MSIFEKVDTWIYLLGPQAAYVSSESLQHYACNPQTHPLFYYYRYM